MNDDDLEAGWDAAESAAQARLKDATDWGVELDAQHEVTEKNEKTRGWFADVGASALRGPVKAVRAMYSALSDIAESVTNQTGDVRLNIGNGRPLIEVLAPEEAKAFNNGVTMTSLITGQADGRDQIERALDGATDAIGAPQTLTGSMTEGVTQFVTGMIPVAKGAKALNILQGTGRAATVVRGLALGAATSAAAFQGHEENLANLVQSFPTLQNPVTEFLATDGDDSEIAGRLKNAVVDAGGGAVFEGFLAALRGIKAMRRARPQEAPGSASDTAAEAPITEPVVEQPAAPALDSEFTLALDEPVVSTRPVALDEIAHDPRLKLETAEQETMRLQGAPEEVPVPAAKSTEAVSAVEQAATKVEQQAAEVEAKVAAEVEASKPKPFRELSPDEQYADMRARLGITDAKLDEFRDAVQAGKVKPEKVADLIGANPDRIDWSNVNDPEDMVGMLNTLTRILGDATGEAAGSARVSLETIAKQASEIGGSFDDALRTWQSTRNLAAHVQSGRAAVNGSAAILTRLAKKIDGGKHTAQDLLDFVTHERRHALLQVTVRGTRAEIGRALRVMREGVGVSEAALKIANGRRMRQARKAGEAAQTAKAAKESVKQARIAKEAHAKAADTAEAATKTADAAEAKAAAAEEQVTSIEGIIKKHTEVRDAAARAAARRAARELEVEPSGPKKAATPTLSEQLSSADDVVAGNRMESEITGARVRATVAREEAKAARAAAREAEKVRKAAEKKAKDFEDYNAKKFGEYNSKADVKLDDDTRLQFGEVNDALRGMGLQVDDVVDLAREIAKRGDIAEVNAAARTGLWQKGADRVTSLYINNLLSGLPTMATNVFSGFYKLIESGVERYGAAFMGGDKFDRIAANKSAIAAMTSWRSAWIAAGRAWKEGLPQTDVLSRIEVEVRGGTGANLAEKVMTAPSRAILTIDEFFKHIFYHQELTQRAVEVAASAARLQPNKLAADKVFESTFKETLANPPDDLVLDAIESARYNTFQGNLESKFASNLIHMTNDTPLTKLVVPFVKTPANIIKQGLLERSPLAALRTSFWKQIAAGGREGRTAAFRAMLGTAVVGIVWQEASEGKITGSRVGRGGQKNSADMAGPPPYSRLVNGTWVQYNRLDPVGTVMGLTADLRDLVNARSERNSNQIESDDMEVGELFGSLMGIVTENVADKTFFKGISDFVSAVHAGASQGGSTVATYATTIAQNLVPGSSMLRNIARSHDEYAREAFTMADKLKAGTPGLSDTLPTKNDFFGRPIRNTERPGGDWWSPFLVGKDDPDPVVKEFAKLEMNYRAPDKDIAGVKLDAAQYSELTRVRGQTVYTQMKEWVDGGDWSKLTKVQKMDKVRQWSTNAQHAGESAVLAKWPEVRDVVQGRVAEIRKARSGEIQ